jgi:site-specific DNA recombinase
MAPDKLQAAIDRVEIKRRQLLAGFKEGAEVARILSTVPRAAELCEERIALGLQGRTVGLPRYP